MIKFFYHPSPNPAKVALLLEELEMAYELVPVDTKVGDQHSPEFLKINPNAKTPAILDGDVAVFDSNAILLYISEKAGNFLPISLERKAEMYTWLMFVASGVGPYSGQAVHFKHFAPEQNEYATVRYDFEAWRHWKILDQKLSAGQYMLGDEYTIVDMAVWGWARMVPFILGPEAWTSLPNVHRLLEEINTRPAAQRAELLKNKYPFKSVVDSDVKRILFPHTNN
ncbi:glutathione S-transferase family protein [Pseudomonas marginalis]|uniref:glutathione S-transferase family protein n=1 Tax=Pseudomonas marginalis TaxID=298 RepID=UPI001F1DF89E|nr:glutathione S-transferase N-terminal domain-containing protein [Pseudomonas marginalis]MCF5669006.1 glutathione S-transferase family protein [Pseudomonas marginalis]